MSGEVEDRRRMIEELNMLKELQRRRAKRTFHDFLSYVNPKYEMRWYHKVIADYCQMLFEGIVPKLMITVPPQHGKLLADNTLVHTPNGVKRHGDLRVGDYVFGRDGKPVKVLAVSPKERCEYVVTFSDGSVFECHGNHEWVVYRRCSRRYDTVTTEELSKMRLHGGEEGKRGHHYEVKVDEPVVVEYASREVGIDPYTLGAWLGDGVSKWPVIHIGSGDMEIVDAIPYETKEGSGTTDRVFYIHGISKEFRRYGLLGSKHVPGDYLYNSVEVRKQLIAGLIDTDGYVYQKNGRVSIANTNKSVVDGVVQVLRSLGQRVTVCPIEPTMSSFGVQGKQVCYQIGFNPTMSFPTRVPRKRIARLVPQRMRGVKSVEKREGLGYGNCIQVEGGVYLVGDTYIPTHNSEIVSRLFPAWALGVDPDLKMVGCSYSATLAGGFNRSIQRVIGSDEYRALFPDTFLNDERLAKYRGYVCNAEMFECVNHSGYYKSVGVGGSLTGTPADIAIIDDPVKDAMEANSPVSRDNVYDWYLSVLSTRLHNDSKQMLILTRWHSDDLAGRILNSPDGKRWKVVNIPAICTEDDDGEFHSGRKVGDALWPERHSLEKLRIEMEKDPHTFNCLYQGNPESAEGRLYGEFKTYVEPGEYGTYVRSGCYIDVADKGTDDTTAVCYDVYRGPTPIWNEQRNRFEPLMFALVKDVEKNPANTDVTRVTVPAMINRQSPAVGVVWCESNSGGDSFGRDVSKKIRAQMSLFHQGANKESRIITNAPMVNTQIIMPFDWERRWPDFHRAVTHYLSVFKANAHDDVPDVLTGIYEKELCMAGDVAYGKRRGIRRG